MVFIQPLSSLSYSRVVKVWAKLQLIFLFLSLMLLNIVKSVTFVNNIYLKMIQKIERIETLFESKYYPLNKHISVVFSQCDMK